MTIVVRGLLAAAVVVVCAPPAAAQMFELVGTRAQGMGGAFVAVADDATASWWNPAGLATGNLLSLVIEHGMTNDPADAAQTGPARRDSVTGVAASYPALAVSYYHLRVSEIAPLSTTAAEVGGRQDQEAADVRLHALALSQFGATFGQSFG